MTSEEMLIKVKSSLKLEGDEKDLTISDVISSVGEYCNLPLESLPDVLEPFIRKKVKGIIDYEEAIGTGYQPELESLKEGDGSITWAQTDGNTRASIYGLSDTDKRSLRRHRRLRGYV